MKYPKTVKYLTYATIYFIIFWSKNVNIKKIILKFVFYEIFMF